MSFGSIHETTLGSPSFLMENIMKLCYNKYKYIITLVRAIMFRGRFHRLSNQNAIERNKIFYEWVEDIPNEKTKGYVKERIIKQMDWYREKSAAYKMKYQSWTMVSIILSGTIPIASVLADGGLIVKILIAALGAAVTSINAYLNLQNYKELWNVYRFNREWLLSTLYLYFNKVGVFGGEMSQENRDIMLIEMCENCFRQEISDWRSGDK